MGIPMQACAFRTVRSNGAAAIAFTVQQGA
jgi:hypothetical protein